MAPPAPQLPRGAPGALCGPAAGGIVWSADPAVLALRRRVKPPGEGQGAGLACRAGNGEVLIPTRVLLNRRWKRRRKPFSPEFKWELAVSSASFGVLSAQLQSQKFEPVSASVLP